MDRSAVLGATGQDTNGAVKVVLLSLDRNCMLATFASSVPNIDHFSPVVRLKARSRQLPAAGEKDLAALLAKPISGR